MAKKVKRASRRAAPKAVARNQVRKLQVALDVPEGTPAFYANFIEVSHTKWDFSMTFTRIPSKHGPKQVREMFETGVMPIAADVVVTFPVLLLPGLLRALSTQKEAFEKESKESE